MTLLAIGIGVVIGLVIGALGGGGGVLTVPALVFLLGVSAHEAASASLVIVGLAALVGVPAHARSGNVRWRDGAVFGAVGTVAAVAGTAASRHLDQRVLLLAFALVIAVAAVLMLRDARRPARPSDDDQDGKRPTPAGSSTETADPAADGTGPTSVAVIERSATRPPASPSRPALVQAAIIVGGGLAVGLMTGLFGVGGGFLAVPVLVLVMRWPMPVAVGTSLLVIVINSGAALAARIGVEAFDWDLIVPVTAAAVVATLAGKMITDRVSSPVLGRTFAVMLVLLAGYTATRSVVELFG